MKISYHKTGALICGLWGLIHVAGGGLLLADALSDHPENALKSLGSALSETDFPAADNPVVRAVVSFHSFNLLWMGLAAMIIALTLNWKNSKTGFFLNGALIGLADAGLIAFMLAPGIIKLEEGIIGPVLWPFSVLFLYLGLQKRQNLETNSSTLHS